MPIKGVEIEGLKELRKELKRMGSEWPKELQKTNKQAAALVVPEAKRRAAQSHSNLAGGVARVGSRGVASIRPLATQRSAQIAGGGAKVPWFGGNEWGSSGRFRQFPARAKEGHILWPAAKAKEPEVIKAYEKMLDDLTKRAFPD